ncbi:MAG: tetratricopeptide repeat protein [Polyangiales bacterium]
MRSRGPIVALLTACLWIGGVVSNARADSPDAEVPSANAAPDNYDQLLDRAVEAFKDEEFARAHRLFERAYALKPNARVLRGLGIAALRLGRYSEAKRALSSALTDSQQALTASQREEVLGLLSWMETNLGTIRVQWVEGEPREYELSVDDRSTPNAPLVLSPGAHRLKVRAPGYLPVERHLEVAAGEEQTLTLALIREKSADKAPVTPSKAAATLVSAPRPQPAPVEQPALLPARQPLRDHASEPSVFGRWWFWTAVGVIAAGGVTTAILLTTSGTKEYEQSSLGQVTMTLERGR